MVYFNKRISIQFRLHFFFVMAFFSIEVQRSSHVAGCLVTIYSKLSLCLWPIW